jgi:hypothetical protein
LNYLPGFALIDARAGWQPAITGMMDAAYFAGFWLRRSYIQAIHHATDQRLFKLPVRLEQLEI